MGNLTTWFPALRFHISQNSNVLSETAMNAHRATELLMRDWISLHDSKIFLGKDYVLYIYGDSVLESRRRQWHPTPVLLPGKSHGWRSLVGCSPWGCEESDTTEQLHFQSSLSCIGEEMATHSSVLAWRIPGTGEPDGLLSTGSHRVEHDWSDLAAAVLQGTVCFIVVGLGTSPMSTELEEIHPKSGGMFLQAGRGRVGKSPCTSLEPHH